MCTVIVGFEPGARTPLVIAGVRDEILSRPWEPPAAHWPGFPGLVGGRDLSGGGTWLAVDPGAPRVAALLNGRGREAPEDVRRSRGDLPLRAVTAGELPEGDLSCYDPFHLIVADPGGVRLWSWDGERVSDGKLPAGVHVVVNSGWERGRDDPRVAWFRPRFASAAWPSARDGESAWAPWRELASGAGLDTSDPRALVVRSELPDGSVWGTSSITLVALGEDALRYDFCPDPADPSSWYGVLRSEVPG
ncbi:NRDE family protein [Sphaerisporangium corydalis]|uniref:NRDE family protein n=1 Tax=Sphaerisporangium corydalis TaxID=1441875 RepID=A0ABV9EDF4_9ACTN|nr:NRDE family protein [Sphaerisporangium corydalis]